MGRSSTEHRDLARPGDGLTRRQEEILLLLVAGFIRNQNMPVYRDLAKSMGISSINAIYGHLKALRKKGILKVSSGSAHGRREISIVGLGEAVAEAAKAHVAGIIRRGGVAFAANEKDESG